MATNPFFQDQYPYGTQPTQTTNAAPSLSVAGGNVLGTIGSGLIGAAGAIGSTAKVANQLFNPFGGLPTTYGQGTYANSTPQSSVAPYSLASVLAPKQTVAPQVAPQLAPKVTQPNVPQTTPTTTSTPSAVTAQTVNDLWLRQGETPEQYKVRTGITQPVNNPVDNSVASLGELSQGQLDEIAAWDALAKQGQADATGTFNTAGEQTKYTNIYQDRINAINALYNDMIAQSRANNAPIYAAREQQGRLSAVMGGIVGNPMAEAQQAGIQTANQKEQAAAEALIIAQQRAEINAIYGKVDDAVAKAQERFDQARQEGGRTHAEAIKNKNAVARAILDENLDLVVGKKLTDADIAAFAKKLGLSAEYVRNEFDKKNREYEASQATAQTQAEKDVADLAYKQAQTAKTTAETAQVGKMSPYQAQQIAIDWYKAKNPAGKATDQKAESFGKVVSLLSPEVQPDGTYKSATIPNSGGVPFIAQGYLTPEGWKEAVRVAASEGIKREDLLTQVRDKFSPDNLRNYGLTASDIKIINGELPQSK